jgi:hypothetical protein
LQIIVLEREWSPIKFFYGNTHEEWWSPKKMQQLVDNRAQHFMVYCFLSYYFFEFTDFFFRINITLGWRRNMRRILRIIQIEIRIYGWSQDHMVNLIKIMCHGLSNTMAEDLQTAHSVSTVGCLQSVSSTQTLEFEAILYQWVQARTTHFSSWDDQTSPIDNGDEIINGWYMCSFLLAPQFRWRPVSSSYSISILD